MTITGIRLSHLHKDEHFQFIHDIITQVEEAMPDVLRVSDKIPPPVVIVVTVSACKSPCG